MKKILLSIAILSATLGIKAQNETVNGNLTLNGNLKQNITGTPSTWFYLIQSSNKNSGFWANNGNPALYLRGNSGNLNVVARPDGKSYFNGGNVGIGTSNPSQKLHIYDGNIAQDILGTPSTWFYLIKSSNQNSGFWANNGNPALYLRDNSGNLNVVARPDGKSYFNGGNVGIGTSNPDAKLTVAGNIHSREVKVTINAGADFVFEDNYSLPSLSFIEKYIKENKHLPEISSEKEMKENGLLLAEMNIKLLQKIEELTLYTIQQQKEIEKLKSTNDKLIEIQVRLDKLESKN